MQAESIPQSSLNAVIVRGRIAEEFENRPLEPILLSLRLTGCVDEVRSILAG
jgi:hypothetical protein